MASNDKRVSSRWRRIKLHFDFGVLLVGAILALALARAEGRLTEPFSEAGLSAAPLPQLSVVLFLLSCAVVALWYFTIAGELEMLKLFGEEFTPPLPDLRLQVIVLGTLLALLVYFSKDPLIFAGLLTALKAGEIVATATTSNPTIKKALEQARNRADPSDERRDVWNILEHYYLRPEHYQLSLAVLGGGLVALVLSAVASMGLFPTALNSIAYGILISCLVCNEVVNSVWRRERDRGLGDRF